MKFQQGNVSQ